MTLRSGPVDGTAYGPVLDRRRLLVFFVSDNGELPTQASGLSADSRVGHDRAGHRFRPFARRYPKPTASIECEPAASTTTISGYADGELVATAKHPRRSGRRRTATAPGAGAAVAQPPDPGADLPRQLPRGGPLIRREGARRGFGLVELGRGHPNDNGEEAMATEPTRPAEAPADVVQARVLARASGAHGSVAAVSCGPRRASGAGARCASRPSGGSPGRNAASSSATSRTARPRRAGDERLGRGPSPWWLNLEAHPDAVVRLAGQQPRPVRARRGHGGRTGAAVAALGRRRSGSRRLRRPAGDRDAGDRAGASRRRRVTRVVVVGSDVVGG